MWDAISAVMNSFNDFLWGWFMIILLLGTHIFLTIRTKFVQRKTLKAIKLSVTKDPDSDGDISPFQALATALASTIGTGNIIGVGTAIALRRFGNLEIMKPAPTADESTELIFSELSEEQIEKVKNGEDLDLALMLKDGTRLRANIYHQRNNIAATYRILRNKIPTFQELDIPEAVRKLINEPRGLVLITGPTGSGKTTTLASMVDYVNNKQAKHVMTIEDPIEYVYYHAKSMIHQREVGRDVDSFCYCSAFIFA